jgi:hypothetical protein
VFPLYVFDKNKFLKIIKNLFRIFSIFQNHFPIKATDWGITRENKKTIKNFPSAISNTPLGYYNRSPPGLDPNTPWYTE